MPELVKGTDLSSVDESLTGSNPVARRSVQNMPKAAVALATRIASNAKHDTATVSGFRTWQEALQYEWAAKYYTRRCRGIAPRRAGIEQLNTRERWTSNSPLARDVPLALEYEPTAYGGPPDEYATSTRRAIEAAEPPNKKRAARRRGFKKTLRGVNY